MTEHEEMLALANEYEAGLQKCTASGYEEYGPDFQRRQQLIITALRRPAQGAPDTTHYLNAIRVRLETLYASAADDPRLREQISDEVDWIDAQLSLSVISTHGAATAKGAPDWWIFEHQDGQRFFADKDIQHGKMAANIHWGENKWTRKPLFAGPAVTSTEPHDVEKTGDGAS